MNFLPSSSLLRRAALVPMLALGLAACDDDDDNVIAPDTGDDIVDIATTTPEVSTLAQAIQAAGLVEALRGNAQGIPGPFTVFAPVNSAFGSLPAGELDRLLQPENEAELQELLLYHVLPFQFTSATLTEGSFTTLAGTQITISLDGGVFVNGAEVTTPDVQASNGVIHLIDEVLLPPRPTIAGTAGAAEGLSTLAAALDATGLDATLAGDGPFTVFAPVDPAFAALGPDVVAGLLETRNLDFLSEILTYHVVPGAAVYAGELTDGQTVTTVQGEDLTIGVSGSAVTVNGASVTTVNIRASNGVIHLIDGVLTPELDIVETALLTQQTTTLATAVQAGDLVTTLEGPGPFTVFAPVNAAFEALGTTRIEELLAPENQALLQKVLTYHVVPGDVRAADLSDGLTVATVEGTEVTFDLSGATPMVNGANIIATDIVTENGVIHLVDGVLTENLDIVDKAVLNSFDTLVQLVTDAGLAATLRGDNGGAGYTVFAPTDDAFAALSSVPTGAALEDVLLYHVVAATVGSGALTDGQVVTAANGDTFTVNIDGSVVSITDGQGNTVDVVLTDVPASNGVIHVIDGVLLPPVPAT